MKAELKIMNRILRRWSLAAMASSVTPLVLFAYFKSWSAGVSGWHVSCWF